MILRSGRLLGRQQRVLDELLGDRAGARDDLAAAHVLVQRPQDRDDVEARVLVEVGVLGGDGGVAERLRDPLDRDEGAAPALGVVELAEQLAVAVQDARRLEDAASVELGVVGQLLGVRGVDADDSEERRATPRAQI